MSNKCLVTRLKGRIDNPNLPYFNYWALEVAANAVIKMSIQTTEVVTLELPEGCFWGVGGSYTPSGRTYNTKTEYAQACSINTGGSAIKLLVPKNKVSTLSIRNITGGWSDLSLVPKFYKEHSNVVDKWTVSGDYCSFFEGSDNLTELVMDDVSGVEIHGDIKKLGRCPNLDRLLLRGSNVTGTWESFVAAQVYLGNKTKTLIISNGINGNVTFNNSKNTTGNLSWETTGDNTTITNNNVSVTIKVTGDGSYVVI